MKAHYEKRLLSLIAYLKKVADRLDIVQLQHKKGAYSEMVRIGCFRLTLILHETHELDQSKN